jgi:hypothetical protein
MAYSNPAADAVNFTVTHRPMRPQKLPIPTALTFLLGGAIRPPASPKIRIRSHESLNLSSSLWTSGVGHFAPLSRADNSGRESLILAQLYQHGGREKRQLSSSVDVIGIDNTAIAASVITYPELAEWHTTAAVDSTGLAAGSAAKAIIRPAAVEVSWMPRRVDNRQTDRSWSVNLRDRPFDPRWDLVPPLQAQPSPLQLLFSLRDGVTPPADSIQFVVQLDSVERSIYPRNSSPAASSLGKCREVDDVGRGPWSRAGWYSHGGGLPLDDDSGGEIGELDPPVEPMEAPYHIMNSIQCFALVGDERIAIAPDNIRVNLLLEGYAWEMTGDLHGRTSVNFLRPGTDGPRHIELQMNGHTWLLAIKSYRKTIALADETYSFTAQSRSMLLAGDQSDKLTVTLPAAIGAWQLVEQVLQPLGFSLDRIAVTEWVQTPEWTLAAQSASWVSVTPMDIIGAIAGACGAIVTPHMTEDKLTITPRYRVSPGKWSVATASAWSHLIPEGMSPTESSERQFTTPLERVLIAGTTHGVITEVVRSGSSGVVSAADVSDVLAQDTAVNAERGRNILAESGQIEIVTMELPLYPPGQSPSLIVPGELVKVLREDGSETMGLAIGNTITPNGVSAIWQSVSLEVHHGNS